MDAGEGFAPPMIRAYETELLATLPALLVAEAGFAPAISSL